MDYGYDTTLLFGVPLFPEVTLLGTGTLYTVMAHGEAVMAVMCG